MRRTPRRWIACATSSTETQARAGFRFFRRDGTSARGGSSSSTSRARILEARHGVGLLASAMLVVEGLSSFYLFSGSIREAPRRTEKRWASYALPIGP